MEVILMVKVIQNGTIR